MVCANRGVRQNVLESQVDYPASRRVQGSSVDYTGSREFVVSPG